MPIIPQRPQKVGLCRLGDQREMRILLLLFLLLLSHTLVMAQGTVSGTIREGKTGEGVYGIKILYSTPSGPVGTITDLEGRYEIRVPRDTVTLEYTGIGYATQRVTLTVRGKVTQDLTVFEDEQLLEEVEVEVARPLQRITETQMSTEELDMETVREVPALLGEADPIRVLQLRPGIQSGGEGQTGLFVRGGSNDQNLVLLDGAQIYNPNHLFGFFSVFNADAVSELTLYKGGFPARYGGRLSSVLEVESLRPESDTLAVTGGVGLIASRLTVQAPIVKDKVNFIIGGRRTYADLITEAINRSNADQEDFDPIPRYFFYDLNSTITWSIDSANTLSLTGYLGRDRFRFIDGEFDFTLKWGNAASSLRWDREINPRLKSQTSLIFSDYSYEIVNQFDQFSFELGSQITDIGGKHEYTYELSDKHTLNFGGQYTYHTFKVGRIQGGSEDDLIDFGSDTRLFGHEFAVFFGDKIQLTDRLTIEPGLRWGGFLQNETFYSFPEPRLASRYLLTDRTTLKASYARMFQYSHLVTNSGSSLPTDVWYPSTAGVQPQRSDQVALGWQRALGKKGDWFFSHEAYYKWQIRSVDFRNGAQLFANPDLEDEFVFGNGWSYGTEVYLEKTKGRTRGWIGYTLSWTRVRFGEINNGDPFFPRQDRRNDLSIVVIHRLSPRVKVSATFVYGTGAPTTLPTGRFLISDVEGAEVTDVPVFTDRSNLRLPDYHRLDLGLIWEFRPRWGHSDLTFSIYNAYNRRNAYFIFLEANEDETSATSSYRARLVSLFPVLPSITYNFRF